jgi:hypothetical protein
MGSVALGQIFLRIFRFLPVIVIPPLFHTHLHLHVAFTKRTRPGNVKKVSESWGALDRKVHTFTDCSVQSVKGIGNEGLTASRISTKILFYIPEKIHIFIMFLVFCIRTTVGIQKHEGTKDEASVTFL